MIVVGISFPWFTLAASSKQQQTVHFQLSDGLCQNNSWSKQGRFLFYWLLRHGDLRKSNAYYLSVCKSKSLAWLKLVSLHLDVLLLFDCKHQVAVLWIILLIFIDGLLFKTGNASTSSNPYVYCRIILAKLSEPWTSTTSTGSVSGLAIVRFSTWLNPISWSSCGKDVEINHDNH